jgi:hypothetical protein
MGQLGLFLLRMKLSKARFRTEVQSVAIGTIPAQLEGD